MGVDLGAVQIGVAEHRLDEAHISAILQHVGGHGVAQQVATAWHIDARVFHEPFHFVAQFVVPERAAIVVDKQVTFMRIY